MSIRTKIFNFKKQTIKLKKQEYKKSKRNQRRKENMSGKSVNKICSCLSEDFSRHPHFWKQGGCLCDNWKPSFLPLLIFEWHTFSRRVTVRWWRQSSKVKRRPIRARERGGVSLSDVLYARVFFWSFHKYYFFHLQRYEKWKKNVYLCQY